MFITFEGGEGSGKTTQIRKLTEFIENKGNKVVITREPGGSVGGEVIRELLVKERDDEWDNITEVLLYYAARRDHVEKLIKPAIAEGSWVISDRFADSTVAYQLYGFKNDNITIEELNNIYNFTLKGFKPDLTFIFDIDPEVGIARKYAQNEVQKYEKKGMEFHNNLRHGYIEIVKNNPDRCKLINANQSVDEIFSDILKHLEPWIN